VIVMLRPSSRASLLGLLQVLESPAPIDAGHARHVRVLVAEVLARFAGPLIAAGPADRRATAAWGGPGSGDTMAAVVPEDRTAVDPAL
jgi:hypothetical protein